MECLEDRAQVVDADFSDFTLPAVRVIVTVEGEDSAVLMANIMSANIVSSNNLKRLF